MKIQKLVIENFRAIEYFKHDFADELGRVQDVTLLVGPNGSGKTSILDAIWFGLMGELGYRLQRENFRTEAEFVVHDRARYAKVVFTIQISEEERVQINNWKDELVKLEAIGSHPGPKKRTGEISWTYPTQPGYQENAGGFGGYSYKNKYDWDVLKARDYYNRLRKLSARDIAGRELTGGVYFFEQERRIVSRAVKHISPTDNDTQDDLDTHTEINIRELLVNFGLKDQIGRFNPADSWYQKIREAFNIVCAPHTMGEVYVPGSAEEYKIDFRDGDGNAYGFDGLSSGERSVLNFLVHYVYKRMSNAIVLIDELEMHLHPTWQRRLIDALRNFNDNNQFIITTHSPILEQMVPAENVRRLGELNAPDWQYEGVADVEDEA